MSWLYFNRQNRKLSLFAGNHPHVMVSKLIGTWDAHNETASNSLGPWPDGTWNYSNYKSHQNDQLGFGPACFNTAYGCLGIYIFDVPATPTLPARTGMGVHAGRQTWDKYLNSIPGRKTMGCIRTVDAALISISATHVSDKLKAIVVGNVV